MNSRIIRSLLILGVITALEVCAGCDRPTATSKPVHPSKPPASEAKTSGLPRLLDLGANQCIPCKRMKPILAELEKEYQGRMQVEFIDVWENPDAAKPYGIESIPTQIFFDASGKELFRHVGFFSKEEILGKWKELGVTFETGAKK